MQAGSSVADSTPPPVLEQISPGAVNTSVPPGATSRSQLTPHAYPSTLGSQSLEPLSSPQHQQPPQSLYGAHNGGGPNPGGPGTQYMDHQSSANTVDYTVLYASPPHPMQQTGGYDYAPGHMPNYASHMGANACYDHHGGANVYNLAVGSGGQTGGMPFQNPLSAAAAVAAGGGPHPHPHHMQYGIPAQMKIDMEPRPMPTPTRASPITIQWLLDNYETAEGVSLPRSTMYYHYLTHCREQKIDAMNPASFGKLIRSVFLGLRTRRLGTRGNSKYHYYGIRIKPTSPLVHMSDEAVIGNMKAQYPYRPRTINKQPASSGSEPTSRTSNGNAGLVKTEPGGLGADIDPGEGGVPGETASASLPAQSVSNTITQQEQQRQQLMAECNQLVSVMGIIDLSEYEPVEESTVTILMIRTFQDQYYNMCRSVAEAVINMQLATIETIWTQFWQKNNAADDENSEQTLTRSAFYEICELPIVQDYIREADYQFYEKLTNTMIPSVLRPIQSKLTQDIRNFAKSLESWTKSCLNGYPESFVSIKLVSAVAFGQTLRRYTSLNHLAQAARAVLQNSSQITQMLQDLNRVDFANLQDQAAWMCQCDERTVARYEQEFKQTLEQQSSLEQWTDWLDRLVTETLDKPAPHTSSVADSARHLMLTWSYYSSLVIRDLTLRSAASFGSFHLIRLLYDEFLFYLIEHKVAALSGRTPLSAVGQIIARRTVRLDGNAASGEKKQSSASAMATLADGEMSATRTISEGDSITLCNPPPLERFDGQTDVSVSTLIPNGGPSLGPDSGPAATNAVCSTASMTPFNCDDRRETLLTVAPLNDPGSCDIVMEDGSSAHSNTLPVALAPSAVLCESTDLSPNEDAESEMKRFKSL